MNILFVYASSFNPEKGGVQRVSRNLGYYFINNSHNVYYLSLKKDSSLNDKSCYYLPDENKFLTFSNSKFYLDLIRQNKIDIVINQGAIGKEISLFVNQIKTLKGFSNVKIISVIHNSINASYKNFYEVNYQKLLKYKINKFKFIFKSVLFVNVLKIIYKYKYHDHFKLLLKNSDKVLFLSKNMINELNLFVNKFDFNKVDYLFNPLSANNDVNPLGLKKEKKVIFVGRIDFAQKRVDILLRIWNNIYKQYPDWKLTIVGNGPDLEHAKNYVLVNKIESINFVGFQNPLPYYKEASILTMTSSYEGLPMVLIEAMSYGVTPILFNSFNSASEIIPNNVGVLIENFDEHQYQLNLEKLMDNFVNKVNIPAIENSKRFAIEIIGEQWINLFKNLKDD